MIAGPPVGEPARQPIKHAAEKDLHAIARRVPVNRTAALVTQAGPKGLESAKRITQVFSDVPLPMRPLPPDAPGLIGVRCGTLLVVGLFAKRATDHALWVCRCVYGAYVARSAKALRNPRNANDCCDRCRQVRYLRRKATFLALGFNPDETETPDEPV